jgi:hypothetical protein
MLDFRAKSVARREVELERKESFEMMLWRT